jgi:hypothetical protein
VREKERDRYCACNLNALSNDKKACFDLLPQTAKIIEFLPQTAKIVEFLPQTAKIVEFLPQPNIAVCGNK